MEGRHTCGEGGQEVVGPDAARDADREDGHGQVLRNKRLAVDKAPSVRELQQARKGKA